MGNHRNPTRDPQLPLSQLLIPIPKEMKALRYSKPEEYGIVTVPLPKLRPNDVLTKSRLVVSAVRISTSMRESSSQSSHSSPDTRLLVSLLPLVLRSRASLSANVS